MKRTLLILSFLLLLVLPAFSQDISYVKVEEKDWLTIQEYVTNSQTQLKEAKNELTSLKIDLEESLKQVTTLRKYSESIQTQLQTAKTWNKVLLTIGSISVAVNIGFIIFLILAK